MYCGFRGRRGICHLFKSRLTEESRLTENEKEKNTHPFLMGGSARGVTKAA
jgi:hypothetical protein